MLAYVREHVPGPRTAPLAGNSIATDRGFIARDMPELDAHLHYRMVDVSSMKELCRRWFPRVFYAKPEKGMAHRALADIEESIRELAYYRAHAVRRAARPVVRAGPGRRPPPCPRDRRNPLRPAPSRRAKLGPSPAPAGDRMVGVAQLVEHLVVVQVAAGSSPVTHPMPRPPPHGTGETVCVTVEPAPGGEVARQAPLAQSAEQLTLNQRVGGSIPSRRTT